MGSAAARFWAQKPEKRASRKPVASAPPPPRYPVALMHWYTTRSTTRRTSSSGVLNLCTRAGMTSRVLRWASAAGMSGIREPSARRKAVTSLPSPVLCRQNSLTTPTRGRRAAYPWGATTSARAARAWAASPLTRLLLSVSKSERMPARSGRTGRRACSSRAQLS